MGETSRHAGSEQSRALGRPDAETMTPLQGQWVPDVASVCCVVCYQDTAADEHERQTWREQGEEWFSGRVS